MQKIRMYTDGAAKGNPNGPGGYGTIIHYMTDDDKTEKVEEFTGGFKLTSNNRMELTAVIVGLEQLKSPCEIMIYSDSKYVVDALSKYWINNWMVNGWLTANRTPVKNVDLWKRLIELKKPHKCKFIWVKGHDGHAQNERCDYLASSSAMGIEFVKNKDGLLEEKLKEDTENGNTIESEE